MDISSLKMGAVLKSARQRMGLSQEALAEKLYLSREAVSKIETDRQFPDIPTLLRWVNTTNAKEVLVAYLCGIDGVAIMTSIMHLMGG